MATNGRLSQLTVVTGSGDGAARESALQVVNANAGAHAVRVSQLDIVTACPAGVAPQRVSSLFVVVARAPIVTRYRIHGRYSGGGRLKSADGDGILTVLR